MICQSCRHLLFSRTALPRSHQFALSTLQTPLRANHFSTSSSYHATQQAQTSSSQASTPPSSKTSATPQPTLPTPISTVPAGTPLKGINFLKGAPDPVALEDDQYPDWLWRMLVKTSTDGSAGAGEEGDLYAKSKAQRRIAAKRLAKAALKDPGSLAPKVPVYEQSVDLKRSDGSVEGGRSAARERKELTEAMRGKRRREIKEGNFLKAMR